MRRMNRRFVQSLLCAAITLFSASTLFAANYIWEGENISTKTGPAFKVKKLVTDSSGKVSGKQVLGIDKVKQGDKVPDGMASYRVNLPAAGKYYLWARVRWSTGCGNQFWFSAAGMNGYRILGGDATYDSMHWIRFSTDGGKPYVLKLKQGVNTFTLKSKKSGAMVDQFLLTIDSVTVPAGIYTPTPNLVKK